MKYTYELLNNNQTLRIHVATLGRDDAIYQCEAENEVNRLMSKATLRIKTPGNLVYFSSKRLVKSILFSHLTVKPHFTRAQQNTSVYEHHTVQLGCFANGDPKPQVCWYKNGQRLITDSRVSFDQHGYLSISEVQITDSGEFLCKATNMAGSATHSFNLNVIGKS